MSKDLFRGTFRASIDTRKGVSMLFLARDVNGKYDASNAVQALPEWLAAAKKAESGLDRYCFYIPEVSQKLPKDAVTLPVAAVEKALKDGFTATVRVGNFGIPKIVIAPPVTITTKVKSTRIDL